MNAKTQEMSTPNGAGMSAIPESAQSIFGAFSGGMAQWLEKSEGIQSEAMRFVSDRVRKDLELVSRLAGCKRPEDFLLAQKEFGTRMLLDYIRESEAMLGYFTNGIATCMSASKAALDATHVPPAI